MQLRLLCLLVICLLSVSALADEVVLDLSTMPGTTCGVEWIEGPCVLWFEAVTAEDYQPVYPPQLVCFPFLSGSTLILFPARLFVNLTGVEGIESIQVDLQEGTEIGATRVMAYLGDTYVKEVNSFSMGSQTVTLPVTAGTYDTLVISGWETAINEIRLVGTTLVDTEGLTLGAVKALYR
jgi:hypothetical protein